MHRAQERRSRSFEAEVEQEDQGHHASEVVRGVPARRSEPRGVSEMRVIQTSLRYSSRSCTAVSAALLYVLALSFSGKVARAQVPASADVIMTQTISLGALPSSGGAQSGGEPEGDTMPVNSAGNLVATNTYGNDVRLFTPQGGTPTLLGTISNPNGVAVDSPNNLYIGISYRSDEHTSELQSP